MNTQKPEPPTQHKYRQQIEIHSIWPTIQGEGPFAGCPAVFVRLAGCNLLCPMCDTDYTSKRTLRWVDLAADEIGLLTKTPSRLVVLSGGEPFRQSIGFLVKTLLDRRFNVQIETNGTLHPDDYFDWERYIGNRLTIVCSPKSVNVDAHIQKLATCYKYVLDSNHVAEDGLPSQVLGRKQAPFRPPAGFPIENIYVQPMDEGFEKVKENAQHTKAAVASCLKFGYRFSPQIHKEIGLP